MYFILASEPELSSLGSQDAISCWPHLFEEIDLGLLWQWLGVIVYG